MTLVDKDYSRDHYIQLWLLKIMAIFKWLNASHGKTSTLSSLQRKNPIGMPLFSQPYATAVWCMRIWRPGSPAIQFPIPKRWDHFQFKFRHAPNHNDLIVGTHFPGLPAVNLSTIKVGYWFTFQAYYIEHINSTNTNDATIRKCNNNRGRRPLSISLPIWNVTSKC